MFSLFALGAVCSCRWCVFGLLRIVALGAVLRFFALVQYSRVGGVVFCGSVSCGGLSSRFCCCLDILSVGIVSIMLGYVFHASELEEEPSYVSFMAWYNGLRLCRPSCHSDRKPESLGNASEMEEDPSHVSCMSARCNCLCLCRLSRHCDRKQPHRYCN